MTADVLRLGPAHDELEALLPWFVNGTLEPDDRARVARHLDECAVCRGEVDALRVFQADYAHEGPSPDSVAAFERLRASLAPVPPPWHVRAWRRLRPARLSRVNPAWLRSGGPAPRWLPWAIGVQLALVAMLATLAVVLVEPERALSYRTLSAPESASTRAGSVVVRFDPQTSEDELRRIVRAADARIVDGPTAADAYVLEVTGGDPAAAVQALRAQKAVVLAEPLRSGR